MQNTPPQEQGWEIRLKVENKVKRRKEEAKGEVDEIIQERAEMTGRWVNKTLMNEGILLSENALIHAAVGRLNYPHFKKIVFTSSWSAVVAECKRA